MLQRLDFWLAVLTLGALAWWELHLDRIVLPIVRGVMSVAGPAAQEVKRRAARQLPTKARLKPRPIRDDGGRWAGSLPAVPVAPQAGNGVQPSLQGVAASGRAVADGNNVAEVTVSPEEAALIGLRLGRGMPPSAIVKSLPGYSPRKNYDLYKAKVDQVQAALAAMEQIKEPQGVE